jgi:hypothetical protein
MKKISLSGKNKNLVCLVDDEDYESLSKYRWYLSRKGYAQRNRRYVNKIPDRLPVQMHTMIIGNKDGLVIDHVNNNKLDNRRSNLRHISNTENIRRRGVQKNSKTGFKGVYFCKTKGLKSTRYLSYIRVDKKLLFVGYFANKEEAAKAYNEASKKHHGEHGYQNAI